MKKIIVITITLAVIICSVAVWSQGGRPGSQGAVSMARPMLSCPAMATAPPHAFMIDRLSQSLKLTKDQTAKLKKIAADSEKTLAPLRQNATKSSQALRTALLASKYDAKNVKNLAAKAEAAEAKIINANIDTWTKIRAVPHSNPISKSAEEYEYAAGAACRRNTSRPEIVY